MTYAFTQDLPFTPDVYRRFRTALNVQKPPGLVVWVAMEIENGVRSIEVWESKDAFERFMTESIEPVAADGFFASTGYNPPDGEPPRNEFSVVDVKYGEHDDVDA